MESGLIKLSEKIYCFPILHGKAAFCLELRKILWDQSFDCFALAFPESLAENFIEATHKLPVIQALSIRIDEETAAYVPIDPCDAYVEGVRQAVQNRCQIEFTEDNTQLLSKELVTLPDPFLVNKIGTQKYYNTCIQFLEECAEDAYNIQRCRLSLTRLEQLEKKFERILFICDFPAMVCIDASKENLRARIQYLNQKLTEGPPDDWNENYLLEVDAYNINTNHMYFALGEFPFYAAELEKDRQNPLSLLPDYLELIKKIFVETRKNYLDKEEEIESISLQKLQVALKYLRNLSVQNANLTPDLFDLITSAKGVFGSGFAVKILEAAKYYPYFEIQPEAGTMDIGVDHIQTPRDDEPVEAVNLLQDEPRAWKTLELKKEPDIEKQNTYKYLWDPMGMCSHVPEDRKIEGFNTNLRKKTRDKLEEGLVKSEKFTSSVKDGIDIRETLRNWHTGNIYVKEIPNTHKNVDTVVILFDSENDDRYPQRGTWYAEHEEESTLTFFSTNPFDKMIGPGIAQAKYGGLSLLFPPRPIRDVFSTYPLKKFHNLTEQLVFGALKNTKEPHISFLSFKKPGIRLNQLAKKFKKKLVWIPMAKFSAETLRKLRRMHILNGKHVRSWASRYIPDS